jgi:hypothetical protein
MQCSLYVICSKGRENRLAAGKDTRKYCTASNESGFYGSFYDAISGSDYITFDEIAGSRGGEYEDDCLLGCCAV